MINLEKKELEFAMTAVNNLPVQGIEGCATAVKVFAKLTQIAKMKEPVVVEMPVVGEGAEAEVAAKKHSENGSKKPTEKAPKK